MNLILPVFVKNNKKQYPNISHNLISLEPQTGDDNLLEQSELEYPLKR